MRVRDAAIASGTMDPSDPRVEGFSRNLVKLGEHTWGNNEGSLFYINYTNVFFDQHYSSSIFQSPLSSFVDQRKYITTALSLLKDHPILPTMVKAMKESDPFPRSWAGYVPVQVRQPISCGGDVNVWIDENATLKLQAFNGKSIELASLYYITHNEADFVNFIRNYSLAYMRDDHTNIGFDKYGLDSSGGIHSETQAVIESMGVRRSEGTSYCDVMANLSWPLSLQRNFGAPSSIILALTVNASSPSEGIEINMDLQWEGKRPTRMAESIWLTMASGADRCGGVWQLHKLGSWISPYDVVINGSRNTHGVDEGVRLLDKYGTVAVDVGSYDVAVVATTERSPVVFSMEKDYVNTSQGIHFSLFNNAWNTNYPVWSQDPSDRFRFRLKIYPSFCKE